MGSPGYSLVMVKFFSSAFDSAAQRPGLGVRSCCARPRGCCLASPHSRGCTLAARRPAGATSPPRRRRSRFGRRRSTRRPLAAAQTARPRLVRGARSLLPSRTPRAQLNAIKSFNADLPVLGREGRASNIAPADDDPAVDAEVPDEVGCGLAPGAARHTGLRPPTPARPRAGRGGGDGRRAAGGHGGGGGV